MSVFPASPGATYLAAPESTGASQINKSHYPCADPTTSTPPGHTSPGYVLHYFCHNWGLDSQRGPQHCLLVEHQWSLREPPRGPWAAVLTAQPGWPLALGELCSFRPV